MITLRPEQADILDRGLMWGGPALVWSSPTGSGKTWLARFALRKALDQGLRAVMVVPLRAIATEVSTQLRSDPLFAGVKIARLTGELAEDDGAAPLPAGASELLIATYEKMDSMLRRPSAHFTLLATIGALVVDEAHLLGESRRGALLEGALTRLRAINPMVQLVLISATLGNGPELASWLGGIFHQTHERPCPLTWETARFRKASEKTQMAAQACLETVADAGQALIFVQSRKRAEELALALRTTYGLAADHHHAGLTRAQREAVEGGFRAGTLAVICATPTLAAGVNLPCRLVILFDSQRYIGASTYVDLSSVEVWQRAGRAGRPGLDTHGHCVVMQPAWVRTIPNYEAGVFEPVSSALSDRRFAAEQVLVAISAGYARTQAQVERLLATSLGALQRRLPDIGSLVATMREAEMLDADEEGYLYATRIGHIAARHMLAPESVLALKQFFDGVRAPATVDVLAVCCALPGSDFSIYAYRDDQGKSDNDPMALLAGVPSTLVGEPALLETLGLVGKRLNDALVRAAVLLAWSATGNAAEAGAITGFSESDVLALRQEVLRVLQAAQGLAEKTNPQQRRTVSLTYAMVAAGMDGEGAYLALIPGLGPVLARRLVEHGIGGIQALADADAARIGAIPGVSLERAEAWRFAAEQLLESDLMLPQDAPADAGPEMCWSAAAPARATDYRDLRALELTVTPMEGGFSVCGGSEPHRVVMAADGLVCDCADFAAGHRCKHIRAVHNAQQSNGSESGEATGAAPVPVDCPPWEDAPMAA